MAKSVSPPLMRALLPEDGSSPATSSSSPLHHFSQLSLSPTTLGSPVSYPGTPLWLRELKSDERGLYLIHLLLNCANHVAAGALDKANACLDHISLLVSPDGDAMQRVAACFTEALAHRILRSWPGLYRAVRSPAPLPDALLARRNFFDLCPFLKLAFLISNQSILEAMEGERMVHVIDLGGIAASADHPAQWLAFLQALSARRDGPPHLRITAVCEHRELLDHASARLAEEAERLDIPFQFNPVVSRIEDLEIETLRVKTGEALAISSVLQLHCLLAPGGADDSSSPQKRGTLARYASKNSSFHRMAQMSQQGTLGELLEKDMDSPASSPPPRGGGQSRVAGFLSSLWGLSPKMMVVTEQESSHNGNGLGERFTEALNFYAAMFDCLESAAGRGAAVERARVERMLWGEEIKNVIASEGAERRERHERLERWGQRMEMAGFGRVRLNPFGVQQARRMLVSYGRDGYGVKEENGCSFVCWQERPLFSVSAWSYRRFD